MRRTQFTGMPSSLSGDASQAPSGDDEQHVSETQSRSSRTLDLVQCDSSGKIIVYLTGNVLRPTSKIRRCMTNAFQSNVDIAGTSWRELPTATMDLYYAEFEKAFTWDANVYSRPVIYQGWYAQASKAYSDHLCRAKRLIKKKKQPTYILPPVKDAYWARRDVQAKSEQMSKNRRSELAGVGTGMAIHHGGSRSAFDHRDHLAREKNIPVENATLKKGRIQTVGSTGSCSQSTGTSAFQPGSRGDTVELDELRSRISAQDQQISAQA